MIEIDEDWLANILTNLCSVYTVHGNEHKLHKIIVPFLEKYGFKVWTGEEAYKKNTSNSDKKADKDAIYAVRGDNPILMWNAHMDIASSGLTKDGFVMPPKPTSQFKMVLRENNELYLRVDPQFERKLENWNGRNKRIEKLKTLGIDVEILRHGNKIWAHNSILGGDDKAGVAACMGIAASTSYPLKIMLTCGEECGYGSKVSDTDFYKGVQFSFTTDRRNDADFVKSIGGEELQSSEFRDFMVNIGKQFKNKVEIVQGAHADPYWIQYYVPETFNMSSGYHNPHSNQEYIMLNQLLSTFHWLFEASSQVIDGKIKPARKCPTKPSPIERHSFGYKESGIPKYPRHYRGGREIDYRSYGYGFGDNDDDDFLSSAKDITDTSYQTLLEEITKMQETKGKLSGEGLIMPINGIASLYLENKTVSVEASDIYSFFYKIVCGDKDLLIVKPIGASKSDEPYYKINATNAFVLSNKGANTTLSWRYRTSIQDGVLNCIETKAVYDSVSSKKQAILVTREKQSNDDVLIKLQVCDKIDHSVKIKYVVSTTFGDYFIAHCSELNGLLYVPLENIVYPKVELNMFFFLKDPLIDNSFSKEIVVATDKKFFENTYQNQTLPIFNLETDEWLLTWKTSLTQIQSSDMLDCMPWYLFSAEDVALVEEMMHSDKIWGQLMSLYKNNHNEFCANLKTIRLLLGNKDKALTTIKKV